MAVYAIRAGDTDLYKIGWSKNPESRLRSFQTVSPYELTVVALLETDDPAVERRIHRTLRASRKAGEWFELDRPPTVEQLNDWSVLAPPKVQQAPLPRKPIDPSYCGSIAAGDVDPVGPCDIARRAGVKPITIQKWIDRHHDFPPACWQVSGRPAWHWPAVLEWLHATGRSKCVDAWERWLRDTAKG